MTKRTMVAAGALVVVVIAGVVGWFVFFGDDAPEAVSNEAANEQLDAELAEPTTTAAADDDEPTAEATTTTTAPADPGDVSGTWVVDPTIGTFDFEGASGSFAGFRVDEELTVGAVTAVGRTPDVDGGIEVADGALTAADVTVDLTTIVSNDSRREDAIQRALDTGEFPTATFRLTEPVALPPEVADGASVSVQAVGELTVHGVTNPVTAAIEANVRDDDIAVVTGSIPIVFGDYGVTPPSAPIVVSVDDEGVVEFQLLLVRA